MRLLSAYDQDRKCYDCSNSELCILVAAVVVLVAAAWWWCWEFLSLSSLSFRTEIFYLGVVAPITPTLQYNIYLKSVTYKLTYTSALPVKTTSYRKSVEPQLSILQWRPLQKIHSHFHSIIYYLAMGLSFASLVSSYQRFRYDSVWGQLYTALTQHPTIPVSPLRLVPDRIRRVRCLP